MLGLVRGTTNPEAQLMTPLTNYRAWLGRWLWLLSESESRDLHGEGWLIFFGSYFAVYEFQVIILDP